jgi:hypothetical protein
VSAAAVESPCVNLCVLDQPTGWCRGCGRTGEEIGHWSAADEPARRAILHRLPARMAILLRNPRPR